MLGHDCMIAPVCEQNARGRHVYLPEDMLLVRFRSAMDYDLVPMAAGHHWVDAALEETPLFIRRGHVIPMAAPAEWSEAVDASHLTLLGWVDADVTAALYDDDGISTDVRLEDGLSTLTVQVQGGAAYAACPGREVDASRVLVGAQ